MKDLCMAYKPKRIHSMTEHMSHGAPGQKPPPFRETILIADDDPHIREILRFALNKEGYHTREAENGLQCLEIFRNNPPDLIVLDILMPELDGTEVCREIRRKSSAPIIFLSSRDDEIDKIVGLELGGDDYITKPFSPRELVARIKAVLRRGQPGNGERKEENNRQGTAVGKLALDQDRFQVYWDEIEIHLTSTEFALLFTLMKNPGRVYSRDLLMERAYQDGTVVTDRTIDSHVRKLRSKFRQVGGEPIETVRGIGYKLGPCT